MDPTIPITWILILYHLVIVNARTPFTKYDNARNILGKQSEPIRI